MSSFVKNIAAKDVGHNLQLKTLRESYLNDICQMYPEMNMS